jgi:hypothetical protein
MDDEVTTKKRKPSKEFVMRQGWLMSGLGWAAARDMQLDERWRPWLADQRLTCAAGPAKHLLPVARRPAAG